MPGTLHDFGGFPPQLYAVQYPAPGSPGLAGEAKNLITKADVGLDDKWGLDHGCWSVVKHLYPTADVPVVQVSMDHFQSPQYHYGLANELAPLRGKGVLIIASGNMVHNLGLVAWEMLDEPEYWYDWAIEANNQMKEFIISGAHQSLIDYHSRGRAFKLSIPTPEHYIPLLYALAIMEENDQIKLFNDKIVAGSLSMTSLKIG